jgi:hypothetical protein
MAQTLFGTDWIAAQQDVEWAWILDETLGCLLEDKGGRINFREIRDATARVAAPTLVERDDRLVGKLTVEALQTVGWNTFCAQPKDWFATTPVRTVLDVLQKAYLLEAATLLIQPVPRAEDSYWPFGQEGGFCNPMKLQLLED